MVLGRPALFHNMSFALEKSFDWVKMIRICYLDKFSKHAVETTDLRLDNIST